MTEHRVARDQDCCAGLDHQWRRLGIDPALVDAILYDAFRQRHVGRIYTTLNQYYVILEVDPSFQLGPNALSRIYVKCASGSMVPLSQLASVTPAVAPLAVNTRASSRRSR